MSREVPDRTAVLPPDGLLTIGDYPLRQADTEDLFYGNRLIYLGWDNHLMYCAPFCVPLPPDLPVGARLAARGVDQLEQKVQARLRQVLGSPRLGPQIPDPFQNPRT